MNTHTSIRISSRGGYTLLFAVLTAALVLGVAVFIVSTSTKQFELAASARNSMYSFYAADAGVECAAAAFANGDIGTTSPGTWILCNGIRTPTTTPQLAVYDAVSSGFPYPLSLVNANGVGRSVFQSRPNLNVTFPNGTCAVFTIYDGYDLADTHWTIIDSRGYNHCTSSNVPDVTLPNTVERALRLSKQG